MKIIFAHGKEGSPKGNKATYLRETFGAITPDFMGKELKERIDILRKYLKEDNDCLLIGSSMGGAAGALVSHEIAPKKLLLLAPALKYDEYIKAGLPKDIETVIIHGTGDDIIDIKYSREASEKYGAELIEVDDGHSLKDSKDLIVETVKRLLKD